MTPAVFLERPLYSVREAARLLRVPPTTLKRWLDGDVRKGVEYAPVIRIEPTGTDHVTWGEFIEAGFLREYTRSGPSFQKIRRLIEDLRADSDQMLLYPLAYEQPFVDPRKRELFVRADESESGASLLKRSRRHPEGGMQIVWAEPIDQFLQKVEFKDHVVSRYFPLREEGLVTIDPDVSFGIPQIDGVRTERLVEAHDAGESIDEVARSWGLPVRAVEQALRWERELLVAA